MDTDDDNRFLYLYKGYNADDLLQISRSAIAACKKEFIDLDRELTPTGTTAITGTRAGAPTTGAATPTTAPRLGLRLRMST